MSKEQFIREALSRPINAIDYTVSQDLARAFPGLTVVEGGEGLFNVETYASAGHCTLEQKAVVYNQTITHWSGHEISSPRWMVPALQAVEGGPTTNQLDEEQDILHSAKNAWFSLGWQGNAFDVLVMHWTEGMGRSVYHYWILAESKGLAEDLIRAVCQWNAELRGEVLVYSGGCWHKDARLFRSIQGSTFGNLILHGDMKQQIREDMEQFFAARETYETYGIPWKRGILFVGPPGNGKTHAVKAIINALGQPCLYVKSFRDQYHTDEENIHNVFERARKSAPCILVLEDLDALLTAQNRSFFLNELDGFAANIGIIVLATTNHPERLDPAILDRPSRFDRKYPFDLPEMLERLAYIKLWNASLKPALRLSDEGISTLSELTEGFSFAYLKELFLSSMMRWIARPGQEPMEQTMASQVGVLREQMVSASSQPETVASESDDIPAFMRGFAPGRVTRFR
ncbi:MAG: ATP-binding protein [Ktedonobacteraceae bacterium]|nr:ATP-binding protein [Ktedonobacteraceae bacterium]